MNEEYSTSDQSERESESMVELLDKVIDPEAKRFKREDRGNVFDVLNRDTVLSNIDPRTLYLLTRIYRMIYRTNGLKLSEAKRYFHFAGTSVLNFSRSLKGFQVKEIGTRRGTYRQTIQEEGRGRLGFLKRRRGGEEY